MTNRIELLKWIVASSATQISTQYPLGYTQCPVAQLTGAQELHNEGNIVAYPNNGNAEGFPVVPTAQGVEAAKAPAPLANVPQPGAAQAQPQPAATAQPFNIKVEDNIPMPAAAQRGFPAREGGNAVDRYGFDGLAIGQSFHLPPSNDPDKKKATHRVFSSTVSQANTKLYPKAFAVREVGADDPAGPGARVWRVADMTGPRPTRKPRKTAEAAPAAAPQGGYPAPGQTVPQGWPAPGQAAGQGGGFPAPGAFPAPGGFVPAGAPSQGTGGGGQLPGFGGPAPFPENNPPSGFAPGGPSFGG